MTDNSSAPAYTEYGKAWKDYTLTDDYENLKKSLENRYGIMAKYAENIIRLAFDAGWNAKFELSKPKL